MLLGILMQERGGRIDPNFEGIVTNDDNVLAINLTPKDPNTSVDQYAVVQGAITGVDANLNPTNESKTYLRAGTSTNKTATQRTFKATGDRFIGDDFQDYAMSRKVMYGVGEDVVTDYVWFSLMNGKGEKGKVAIIVNSDGSGAAGEAAGIDVDLQKTRDEPEDFVYTHEGTLGVVTLSSEPAGETGKTVVTASPALPSGLSAHYTTDIAVTLPEYDEIVTGWSPFFNGQNFTATTGDEFAVAYTTADGKARFAGKVTVTAAE